MAAGLSVGGEGLSVVWTSASGAVVGPVGAGVGAVVLALVGAEVEGFDGLGVCTTGPGVGAVPFT